MIKSANQMLERLTYPITLQQKVFSGDESSGNKLKLVPEAGILLNNILKL